MTNVRSWLIGLVSCAIFFAAPQIVRAEDVDELKTGQAAFDAAQYDEALKHFDQNVDSQPTSGDAHYWRAKCLAALGRAKEAGGEYRTALLLSTDQKIKEDCRAQLKQLNQAIPEGSVQSAIDAKRPFKLSSRKLDWNIPASASAGLNASLQAQDQELASLIEGGTPRFGAGLASGPPPPAHNLDVELQEGPPHTAALTAGERALLVNSDVVIILDHSGSMATDDCPKADASGRPDKIPQSRLAWSTEEMQYFSRQLIAAMPHGFTFITFDTQPDLYEIKTASEFDSLLRSLHSSGGTRLTPAFERAFAHHATHLNQPLLIAIVSDCEIDARDSLNAMASATLQYPLPNGAFFTFLQIGITAERPHEMKVVPGVPPDPLASLEHIKELGGAYNSSTLIPFSQLRRTGFGKAILLALRATRQK